MSMLEKRKSRKKASIRQLDPYLEREKTKYANPLPSREYILSILTEQGVPLLINQFVKILSIKKDEKKYFERRLIAMSRDGQVMINRKGAVCIPDKLNLIKCYIQGHKDGYGFAVPDDGGDDLFLPEKEMRKVIHGDQVMVRRLFGVDRRGRAEGRIVEIVNRVLTHIVGRIYKERGVWLVVPEDKRINQDIVLEPHGQGKAKDGQVVVVKIVTPPETFCPPIAKVIEVLGNYADSGIEIEIALRKHALPYEFDDSVKHEIKKLPTKVLKKDHKGRVDLRHLPFITIDGEASRDFDDAVYAEKEKNMYRLMVAIADVSHYVQVGTAIDQEAFTRGTSVYFPRRVIPMLPEALSNGLCSLNPDVERLSLVCDMQVNVQGIVESYTFYPAIILSHARMTYNKVWEILENNLDHPMKQQLFHLHKTYTRLLKSRKKRGALEFESVETQMIFNSDGKIEDIVPIVRNESYRIIEECMLAANVCAADFLIQNKHHCLFRVHEGPHEEKLKVLRTTLKLYGLTLEGGEQPDSGDYAKLVNKIKTRKDAKILQTILLRSMRQANYSPENKGHFGLAYPAYTHFTSPIRRYPDLLVHRAIKAILITKKLSYLRWKKIGEHCSLTERRADEACRDVEHWLKTYYMKDKVGEVFSGTVTSVSGIGLFVLLDNIFVEGLVHISELGQDYFKYVPETMSIVGEHSGKRYRLGDTLCVKVVAANLETSKIDFALITTN